MWMFLINYLPQCVTHVWIENVVLKDYTLIILENYQSIVLFLLAFYKT